MITSLFKSNSILLGVKKNSASLFGYLPYIQAFNFDLNQTQVKVKPIGESLNRMTHFEKPETEITIDYLMNKDFIIENYFDFLISTSETDFSSFLNIFNGSSVDDLVVFLNNIQGEDIIKKITINDFTQDIFTFCFSDLFLTSYSFNYSSNSIATASIKLISNKMTTSKISFENQKYYYNKINDASGNIVKNILSNQEVKDFYNFFSSKTITDKSLILTIKDFSLINDQSYENAASLGFFEKNLLDGIVESMQFSVDFKRQKDLFFDKTGNPLRTIMSPIIGNVSINGKLTDIKEKSILELFSSSQNFKFKMTISFGSGNSAESNSLMMIKNIYIISSSFSVANNDFVNYSIQCEFEITKENSFQIITKSIQSEGLDFLYEEIRGSDSSHTMKDSDLNAIAFKSRP